MLSDPLIFNMFISAFSIFPVKIASPAQHMILPDDEDIERKRTTFYAGCRAILSEYPYKIHNAITEVFSKLRTGLFPVYSN
jgi:hypothetical protein